MRRQTTQFFLNEQYLNRNFTKDIQKVNKNMKRYSTTLVMIELQIKSTMRYHFTLTGIAKI